MRQTPLALLRKRSAAPKDRREGAGLEPPLQGAILTASLLCAMTISGCGYHVAGRASTLPKTVQMIAVPAFENKSTTFKIEQKLTAATIHEFLAKTRYRVTSDPKGGDAVLSAKVLTVEVQPLLFQSQGPEQSGQSGSVAQATAMMITMKCEVTLTERDTDKVLYHADNFVFRNEYQLATLFTNPNQPNQAPSKNQVEQFFQEGEPAFDRMARDFATRLVAAVLENY